MKKKILISTFIVVAFSLVITPVIAMQNIYTTEIKITPEISTPTTTDAFAPGVPELVQRGSEPVGVVIETSTPDYTQISAFIEELGGVVTAEYTYINGLAATVQADTIPALASEPSIIKIYEDSLQYPMASSDFIAAGDMLMAETPGVEFKEVSFETIDPATYTNPYLTNADLIWGETDGGELIAVNPDGTERWRIMIATNWEIQKEFEELEDLIRKTKIVDYKIKLKNLETEAKLAAKKENYNEAAQKFRMASRIASEIFKLGVTEMTKEVKRLSNKSKEYEKLI